MIPEILLAAQMRSGGKAGGICLMLLDKSQYIMYDKDNTKCKEAFAYEIR